MAQQVVIYTRASRDDIRRIAATLPAIMSGRATDDHGIAHGFKMLNAYVFLGFVKTAFDVKGQGGTDEAGIKWAPLSKEYLAYGRRFQKGEQAKLKQAAGLGKGNNRSPGGKGGLLTAAQEKLWWQVYKRNLAWLAARELLPIAKGKAAAIAWTEVKKAGGKTKLDVYGSRQVQIGKDVGTLYNSLSPGELVQNGTTASLLPAPNQIIEDRPGELIIGTNVPYAAAFHKRRPLWPEPDQIPQSWFDGIAEVAVGGLIAAVKLLHGEVG